MITKLEQFLCENVCALLIDLSQSVYW